MSPRRPTLSISSYALAFIALLALGLALALTASTREMDRAIATIREEQRLSAAEELRSAVAALVGETEAAAAAIAGWDEARQQLQDPTYYAYWREYRLLHADRLPPATLEADLYDRHGTKLNRIENGMPQTVDLEARLVRRRGRIDLLFFRPVVERGTTIGFVGLRRDFHRALTEAGHFHTLDAHTLRLPAATPTPLPLTAYLPLARFELLQTPETVRPYEILSHTLYRVIGTVALLAVAFYTVLGLFWAAPLRRLSRYIDELRHEGGGVRLQRLTPGLGIRELEKVRHSLNDYQARLEAVHEDLNHKNRELWQLAHRDPLTGIYNRRAFEEDGRSAIGVVSGRSTPANLVLYDCNHFKSINDTYGHGVGDEVIRRLAGAITASLRQQDRLYRLGGDEFGSLLVDCSLEDARAVASRCLEAVTRTAFTDLGIKEPVRISIGLAHTQGLTEERLEQLHWQADAAMYRAKRPGAQPLVVYTEEMAALPKTLFSSRVVAAVYEAVSDGSELEIHYQPVVALQSGEVSYYEALVRIRRDDELIMPANIFPVVAARNLDTELDFRIFERLQRDLAADRLPPGTGVSLNLSAGTVTHPRVLERLRPLRTHLDRYRIVLEVTETALITQLQQASSNLQRLREQGFHVALDDFGSGYSSLRYLAHMPIDVVKFDISMVRMLHGDTRQQRLFQDMAELVYRAGYRLLAEGIEGEETHRRVAALGFSYGQGYHYGRPRRLQGAKEPLTDGDRGRSGHPPAA